MTDSKFMFKLGLLIAAVETTVAAHANEEEFLDLGRLEQMAKEVRTLIESQEVASE